MGNVEAARLAPVSRTALWTAAARARETARPDRLFADPYAATLAGDDGAALLTHFDTAHASPAGNPFLPIRTRWFDDRLRSAARTGGQVVGLGAGLDTRAYRLAWPAGTRLFDVDRPDLLAYKEQRLRAVGAVARCERRPVAVDLGADWTGALTAAGLDPAVPTCWFGEGLVYYLPAESARSVLRGAAALSAPGSTIVVDLIGTGVFRLPYTRPLLRRLAAAGSPWAFGTDDPAGFVSGCGWPDVVVTEPGRAGASFGRWPGHANPRDLPGLPRSYLVVGRSGT